jgi:hypothetical protein
MDLRATLEVVAEFLPVEGVPEIVVLDCLCDEADLGTIDEPLRQLLLARSGTIEAKDGWIVRRLGNQCIALAPFGDIFWARGNVNCRGGDLPAADGPQLRAWYADLPGPRGEFRVGHGLPRGARYTRPGGLPSIVSRTGSYSGMIWPDMHHVILTDRGMEFRDHERRELTDAELATYRAMFDRCWED